MKIFAAHLSTETNTFAPCPTGWGGFQEYGIFRGDASIRSPEGVGYLLAELRRLAQSEEHEIAEGLGAEAQPSGPVIREVYETLRDEIVAGVRAALPLDAVVLMLHGAMVAQHYDDCEGDLLACIREVVGPDVPIAATLDPHCHFTERMQCAADILIAYKEYPHTDAIDRLREVYRLVTQAVEGKVKPVTAVFDCRMVGAWHTTSEPMAGFVRRMKSFEGRDGILSVSLGHGFPWGDVPEAGAKLWVIADRDPALASALAHQLGQEFWAIRREVQPQWHDLDHGLDIALAVGAGPVVVADVADNPGGGAPGDSTFILRRVVERGIPDVALGCFWDLGAIQICADAGVGATLDLRIGGKCGAASGDPIDLRVTVRAVHDTHSQSISGMSIPLGRSIWVEGPNGLDIVLVSVRTQVIGVDAFTGIGVPMDAKRLVVVKSTQHFQAEFAPRAKAIVHVAAPGALTPDFAAIPYRHRDLNYWPRVENPFA
ncbi:microcystin LR degradation protein MlrC-like protein [Pandoraea fibrosis]|uniref:Microcystinase C n=1 Tax=Pandoraea fibrosis TaxID=1891094 RepID=A0ABX6HMT1_9BURK|nr:M81 family metallopeptidase [Pandoraea fibrosis]QHE91187.1 microcystin LR degradation protein MlrC-like protein [Pandoraea fibrosis]QHF12018.1 microcystin LR degradation protein MlrC-like protein [Pandoraea fibrosis]